MNKKTAEHFLDTWNRLDQDSLELLDEIYDADVRFQDPIREIRGLDAFKDVLREQYQGVRTCGFEPDTYVVEGSKVAISWVMRLDHVRFKDELELHGCSFLRFTPEGKVAWHRDYFDMGEFIYERLPVLGFAIAKIKKKL